MTYLELVRKTARISGVLAGLPSLTTVNGASGRAAQLVGWVSDAWVNIQNERSDWLWPRKRFSEVLTPGVSTYTPAALNLTRVGEWELGTLTRHPFSIYDPAEGKKDEGSLAYLTYDRWMDMYDMGVHDEQRPSYFTVSPQNELMFGPTPDKAYVLRGGYVASPQVLTNDDDVPEMPERFHDVIIPYAIALMSGSDEVFEVKADAKAEYGVLRTALINNQTGRVSWGGYPIA